MTGQEAAAAGFSTVSEQDREKLAALRERYPEADIMVRWSLSGGGIRATHPAWPNPVHAGSVSELADLLAHYA